MVIVTDDDNDGCGVLIVMLMGCDEGWYWQ